jgi:type IV secretion system protein VirD4
MRMFEPWWLVWAVAVGMLYGGYCLLDSVVKAGTPPPEEVFEEPDTTLGDARLADWVRAEDIARMRDLLPASMTGLFLGWAIGNFRPEKAPRLKRPIHYAGPRHLLTVAPTRSGKGVCAIIPNLLTLDRSVICIDPKGQNAAVTARYRSEMSETYLLNPFNEHGLGTSRFNPLAHLSIDDPNVFADVASLAEALIITEGKDPHWPDSARNLCSCLILHELATKGAGATLPGIRAILGLPDELLVKRIGEMAMSPYPFIAQLAGQFLGATNEIKNIVSTARTQTKFLSDPLLAHPERGVLTGDDFRLADFKRYRSTLYVILPSRHTEAYARLLRLVTVSAIDQLTASTGGVPTVLMLDEFKMLGRLSAVETAFSLAAGYNLQIWPFVQNLNQLVEVYGEKTYQDFVSGCGVLQFFAPNDEFTAEFISKRTGDFTQIVRNKSTNHSFSSGSSTGHSQGAQMQQSSNQMGSNFSESTTMSESTSKMARRLLTQNALMAMADIKSIIFLHGLKYPILAERHPYWEIDWLEGRADTDPFHTG